MSRARILVVDDEQKLCDILKDILEIEGYEVEICFDEASAYEKLASNQFDIAIVDVFISNEPSGILLARHIAECYPETSLILMTGFADEADICRAFEAGAYACITKPFMLDDVLRVVGTVLDNRGQNLAFAA
ncbi:MAG: response regulator [Armatimonadota bacterium]|nr:response regulator [Armatimonadota bacterium]